MIDGANKCSTIVSVLAHPKIRGGTFTLEVQPATFPNAAETRHTGDAHYQGFRAPRWPHLRVTNRNLGKDELLSGIISFDVDTEGHALVTPEWWQSFAAKVAQLPGEPFVYSTAHGARIVYALSEPFGISNPLDAAEWKVRYELACDELEAFGIVADRSCSDWQRLFRLPHVVRNGVATEPIIVGDANAIGVFRLPEASLKTQGFNIPGPVRAKRAGQAGLEEALAETPRTALLDDLLRNELVIGIGPLEGSFRVICPRDAAHSTGNPGDGSTLYHAPSGFGGSGWLSCMHQGCKAACKTVRQWRREISKRSGEGISATERIT